MDKPFDIVEAALDAWFDGTTWRQTNGADHLRHQMRRALDASTRAAEANVALKFKMPTEEPKPGYYWAMSGSKVCLDGSPFWEQAPIAPEPI